MTDLEALKPARRGVAFAVKWLLDRPTSPAFRQALASIVRALGHAQDSAGNVYVSGYFTDSAAGRAYMTFKYRHSGTNVERAWFTSYNGPTNKADEATAMTVDHTGNVYVTGSSIGIGTSADYATLKYNTEGTAVWTNRYTSPGSYIECATNIAVDAAGNIYVTGFSQAGATGFDYATLKYDPNGVPIWTNRYNGPGNSTDQPSALTVDNTGNVYVTGFSYRSTTLSSADYATVKYDSNSTAIWTNRNHEGRERFRHADGGLSRHGGSALRRI